MHRTDSGESDRRLSLLTEEQGIVDVVAKGARKSGSRLAGASEPMVLAEFTWADGRANRFLQHVRPVTSFPGLRQDYDRIVAGVAWCDTLRTYLPYGAPGGEAFSLSVTVLAALEQFPEPVPVLVWGFARLLMGDGVAPDWLTALDTGERVSVTPVAFDFVAGGPVEDATQARGGVQWVDAQVLIGLSRVGLLETPPVKMAQSLDCLDLLKSVLEFHTDRKVAALGGLISELRARAGV